MGATASSPAPDDPQKPPDDAPEPDTPIAPLLSLTDLPRDLTATICSHLELQSLSAIASACGTLRSTIEDSLWHPHLERLAKAGDADAEDEGLASRRITNSIQRQAALYAASTAAEAAAFSVALAALRNSTSSNRLRVGRLRALVCNLCEAAPSSATYFPNIKRGVCQACARKGVAKSWSYHQSALEHAAIARRDAAIGARLQEELAPCLPTSLRDVTPRLIFSSDVHGCSLATMLRNAHASKASILVATEEELDGHSGDGGAPMEEPASRKTLLSPLALDDIGRQSRRRVLGSARRQERLFGAFCPAPWPRAPNARPQCLDFGDESSFLFALSPRQRVCRAKGRPWFRCDGERGLSVGGDALLPALSISTDLATGRCVPCHTFGDLSELVSGTDEFAIGLLQLWDLTPPDDEEAVAGKAALDAANALTARRADAMMLPFRTSVMLRAE